MGVRGRIGAMAPASKRHARADWFSLDTPRLQRGQIELLTLSTSPGAVKDDDGAIALSV